MLKLKMPIQACKFTRITNSPIGILWCLALLQVLVCCSSVATDAGISNHIRKCCLSGLRHAQNYNNCQNYEYEVQATIPPLWRGLCYSTYSVCCARELEQQHCLAGQRGALEGLRCDGQLNTTAYTNCCRACQVGLAVKASENDCEDLLFAYFTQIKSYRECCGSQAATADKVAASLDSAEPQTDSEERGANVTNNSNDNIDDAIVLPEDDDDICGKVQNLCQQVCENTKEAYRCMCYAGYKLDRNNVTCSLASSNSSASIETSAAAAEDTSADTAHDDDDDEDDDEIVAAEDAPHTGCPLGYEYGVVSGKCVDIDECARPQLAKCRSSQYCHNTAGGYRCLNIKETNLVCAPGYEYTAKLDKCADIDECTQAPCESGYVCVNTLGSYECLKSSRDLAATPPAAPMLANGSQCGEGFQHKHGHCVDIDECAADESACDSSQVCTNDIGGYHCDCKIGFNLDTTTNACVDINECSINNHNCLPTQRCDNTVGSYICTRLQSCGTGYTLNAETGNCVDDDECALSTHNCPSDYECYNTKGSFRCYRRPPTTSARTNPITTTSTTASPSRATPPGSPPSYWANIYDSSYDQNRIAGTGGYVAHQTSSRHNLHAVYEPRNVGGSTNVATRDRQPTWERSWPPCDVGFQRNNLGACVDVNECAQQHACGSHQRCSNTNGSYRCHNLLLCSAGYKSTPDGTQCIDIDECETNEHNCAENQICRNRQGGYICACPAGHQLQRLPDSNYQRCVDVNECEQERPAVCPSNAKCQNTIGSYYCECKSGYQKSLENERICIDVDECQEILGLCQQKCVNFWGGYRCSCNHGYELSADNRTCNDVDECEVHKAYKLCMGFCINVPGSYECACPRGYTLATDKTTCRDIDECATGEFCTGRSDICTNIRGSYKCTTVHCPYGYSNDLEQKNRCRQTSNHCDDDDCYNKPSAYTYNFITLVSKLGIPPDGRTIFSLRGPAWYDDIDFDLKIVKIQAAANIEKASDNHFDTIKGKHEVHLSLKRTLEGPQDIELELSMTVFTNGLPRGKSVAKIFILVSQYTF